MSFHEGVPQRGHSRLIRLLVWLGLVEERYPHLLDADDRVARGTELSAAANLIGIAAVSVFFMVMDLLT